MKRRAAALAVAITVAALASGAPAKPDRQKIRDDLALEGIRDCRPAIMERCWYLVFGKGEAPNRRLWIADMKVRPVGGDDNGIVEMDVIEASERDAPGDTYRNEFVQWTLQFDCRKHRMRQAGGYALEWSGKIDRSDQVGQWLSGYQSSWFGHAEKLACDADVRLAPQAQAMLWIGDFYRPIDLNDFIRRHLWKPR